LYNEIRNALESSLECSGSSLDTPSRMITLLQFDAPVLIAVICIVLLSGLIHGTLGLGFPMVATPLLATMMDVRSAILITLLPTMAVNITSIVSSESRLATASRFWPLIGFAALGTVIGSSALATTDPAPFRILLAALILLYLWNGLHIPRRWLADNALAAMALFGLIAGMAAGTTNVMVAVLIIYFLSLETARATLIPALNSCFFGRQNLADRRTRERRAGQSSARFRNRTPGPGRGRRSLIGATPTIADSGRHLSGHTAKTVITPGDRADFPVFKRGRPDRVGRGILTSLFRARVKIEW